MKPRTFEIIEEVSTQGIWTWLEIDKNSNSLYLEFSNFKLLDGIVKNVDDYRGDLSIRFGDNLYFSIFYNTLDDLSFLNLNKVDLAELFGSNSKLTDNFDYFYREFSKKVDVLKFQDYNLLKDIAKKYEYNKILVQNLRDNESYDFLLILESENLAIAVGANFIHCFNDFESLNDDDIKRLSNKWVLYYLDYWNKKGTENEYVEDLLCEEFPFIKR